MYQVLIADDSLSQRHLMAEWLIDHDFQVSLAKDGLEALEKAFFNHPDLIVLDIVMPYLNGYEVCRRLKNHPKTKDIPVILCSIKTTQVDHYWGLKQGANVYIDKPFRDNELINIIQQLLT